MLLKLKFTLKSNEFRVQIDLSSKIKIYIKFISLQVQKMTQNRVQILGFKNCHKEKILSYVENITQMHHKTLSMNSQK